MLKKDYKKADPEQYAQLFNTELGQDVLNDLLARFYHIQSFTKDNPHMTSYLEGQRFVLGYIQNKIAVGEEGSQQPDGE